MAPIVETPIHKKCTMQCKKNKYETVILLSLIMKPNKYLMNNAIVIVPSDKHPPFSVFGSSHLTQSHQSDNLPLFFLDPHISDTLCRTCWWYWLRLLTLFLTSITTARTYRESIRTEHHKVCTSSIESKLKHVIKVIHQHITVYVQRSSTEHVLQVINQHIIILVNYQYRKNYYSMCYKWIINIICTRSIGSLLVHVQLSNIVP